MKRVVVVLALALMLVTFGWNQVFAEDIYDDGNTGDDHPWGSESPSEDPGQYRHTRSEYYLTGIVAIDLIFHSTGITEEIESIFRKPVNRTVKTADERDCHIDRTRQLSID